jgi:integrase
MALSKRNGNWVIDYYAGTKRIRETVGPTTKRQAELLLAKRLVEIKEGDYFIAKKQVLFEEAADSFLTFSQQHKRSHHSDRIIIQKLLKHFKGKDIQDITVQDVEAYQRTRLTQKATGKTTTCSPSTINRELACFKTIMEQMVKKHLLKYNVVKSVKLFDERHLQRDRVLDESEYQNLVRCASPHMAILIRLAWTTGMRKGEILDLKWQYVDLGAGTIYLPTSKNGQSRLVPLSDPILVSDLWKLKSVGAPFYMTEQVFRCRWREACKDAGLVNFKFHDLRHTAITRWMKQGIPEHIIMKVSGHKTRSAFDRYVNYKDRDVLQAFGHQSVTKSDKQISQHTESSKEVVKLDS